LEFAVTVTTVSPDWDMVPIRYRGRYIDGTTAKGEIIVRSKSIRYIDADLLTPQIVYGVDLHFPIVDKTVPMQDKTGASQNVLVGAADFSLPATDDPDIAPNHQTFEVTEAVIGITPQVYDIEVPIAMKDSGIDLASVSNVTPSPGYPPTLVTVDMINALQLQIAANTAAITAQGQNLARTDLFTTGGEATMNRNDINSVVSVLTSQMLRLTYLQAARSNSITKVKTVTGTTSGVGVTLARVGIYGINADNSLTLLTSTPNDVAMWTLMNFSYTKNLSSPFNKVAGTWYAIGLLTVATTPTTMTGAGGTNVVDTNVGAVYQMPPVLAAKVPAMSDLPSNIAAGSLQANPFRHYIELLP
jgi:hypothetical protein